VRILLIQPSLDPPGGGNSLRDAVSQIFPPGRGHIHHRLVALGWSSRRTVIVLYLVTLALSALASDRI
jgi:UDP-N-acetylmuramyl pentapeptide phosphotransferase/UDP-N-acetylglucosamine-1-phosphate transferase